MLEADHCNEKMHNRKKNFSGHLEIANPTMFITSRRVCTTFQRYGKKGLIMIFGKRGLASTALLFIISTPIYAGPITFTGSQATTGGLRIQLDAAGNLIQPDPVQLNNALPAYTGKTSGNVPKVVTPPAASSLTASSASDAQKHLSTAASENLVKSGKVVRLNGLFHAASRANINADGQLESDCHVGANGDTAKGHSK